jgi:hypothetical protein
MYAHNQQIGKSNNFKVFGSNKILGSYAMFLVQKLLFRDVMIIGVGIQKTREKPTDLP